MNDGDQLPSLGSYSNQLSSYKVFHSKSVSMMSKEWLSIFIKRNGFTRQNIAGVIAAGPHLVLVIIVIMVMKKGTAAQNHGELRKAIVPRLQLTLFQMTPNIPGLILALFINKVIRSKFG